MKKVFICLILLFSLCSCSTGTRYVALDDNNNGMWISCYELNKMLKSERGFKSEFREVIENCKLLNLKNLYIHTRAFGEVLYNSDYFPTIAAAVNCDYDVFGYIVKECHNSGLLVHAWINPYRISSDNDVEKLSPQSPAYKWLKDNKRENDTNIAFAGGIYFNPASMQVKALLMDEIRELVAKYEIDGIHFDDYFYPTQSIEFDKAAYTEYKKQGHLSLEDWRRENVNLLISSVYSTVKYINQSIIFSISPAASIEHNYNILYANVSLWIKEGWVDEIIPQLYFGFNYPDKDFCFENLVKLWKNEVSQNQKVLLKIGLACYKAIPSLEADKSEWEENSDIIARQVRLCDTDPKISGYVYFSYSSLFGNKTAYKQQLQNILEYLKQEKINE